MRSRRAGTARVTWATGSFAKQSSDRSRSGARAAARRSRDTVVGARKPCTRATYITSGAAQHGRCATTGSRAPRDQPLEQWLCEAARAASVRTDDAPISESRLLRPVGPVLGVVHEKPLVHHHREQLVRG